jgi:hypothetical protein
VLPDVPEVPVVPDDPEVPVLPEVPDVPVVPDVPEVPDVPAIPLLNVLQSVPFEITSTLSPGERVKVELLSIFPPLDAIITLPELEFFT